MIQVHSYLLHHCLQSPNIENNLNVHQQEKCINGQSKKYHADLEKNEAAFHVQIWKDLQITVSEKGINIVYRIIKFLAKRRKKYSYGVLCTEHLQKNTEEIANSGCLWKGDLFGQGTRRKGVSLYFLSLNPFDIIFFLSLLFLVISIPDVGLKLTPLRSRVVCSSNRASQVPRYHI